MTRPKRVTELQMAGVQVAELQMAGVQIAGV
jgi:hypothetical protein